MPPGNKSLPEPMLTQINRHGITRPQAVNPCRAEFISGNMRIYMYQHFLSFLETKMLWVVDILLMIGKDQFYPGHHWSIPWLLMTRLVPLPAAIPWRCKEPEHQQPWYILVSATEGLTCHNVLKVQNRAGISLVLAHYWIIPFPNGLCK